MSVNFRRFGTRVWLALVVTIIVNVPRALQAQGTIITYLGNNGEPSAGMAFYGSDFWIGQSFETGNNAGGYILNQPLFFSGVGAYSSILSIYTSNNGVPGISLGATGITLLPSTTYWLVATASTPAQSSGFPSLSWNYASEGNYTSVDNWSLGPTFAVSPDGSAWTLSSAHGPFQFAVSGSPAPEPSTFGTVLMGFAAACLRHRLRGRTWSSPSE